MALYFLGVVRYSLTDKIIARFEYCFHIVTFVLLETLAITLLFYEAYNPMWFEELGCWFGPWPPECVGDECERGEHYVLLGNFGAIIFQVGAFVIILISNVLIYRSFRAQENAMRRYASGGNNNLSREIAIQGFLYSAAALNTFFWGFLSLLMGTTQAGSNALFFFSLMVCTTSQRDS